MKKNLLASWEKWALMGSVHMILSCFVYYFNLRVFGPDDAPFYGFILVFLGVVSFFAAYHIRTNEATSKFTYVAFVVEVCILLVLAVHVVVSLSVLREMSLAGQSEKRFDVNLTTASKFKSETLQSRALNMIAGQKTETKSAVFKRQEEWLRYLLIFELAAGLIGAISLVAYSLGDKDKNGKIDFFEDEEEEAASPPPPAEEKKAA